jgi:hypothetical protein
MDDDVVLKAALLPCYWARPPHRREQLDLAGVR